MEVNHIAILTKELNTDHTDQDKRPPVLKKELTRLYVYSCPF